jgi:hypothetical protein
MAKGETLVNVLVTIADEQLPNFSKVVKKLEKVGLSVQKHLENVGIVTGSVPKDKMKSLTQVEGVADVSPEQEIHLDLPKGKEGEE